MYEYTSTVRIPIWSRWLGWLAFTQLARVRVPVWEISIYLSWWVEEYSSLGRRFDSGCREITSFVQRLVYQPSKLRSRVRVPDDVMFIFRTYMIILFSDVTPIGYRRASFVHIPLNAQGVLLAADGQYRSSAWRGRALVLSLKAWFFCIDSIPDYKRKRRRRTQGKTTSTDKVGGSRGTPVSSTYPSVHKQTAFLVRCTGDRKSVV